MNAALRRSELETFHSSPGRAAPPFPIDLVHLSRQTMGDRALETELLALFDRQAEKIAAQISNNLAASAEAPQQRADLAHKLKGSARAVGAHAVAAAAENYEHCARAGILRPMDVDQVVEAVRQVRAALRELAG